MRFLDQKRRVLMVDKVPCKCLYSIWLCYSDGRVRRTIREELRRFNSRAQAETALKKYAQSHGCERVF
jgi:hypothetical protein